MQEYHYRPNVSFNPAGAMVDVYIVTATAPLVDREVEVYPGNPAGLNVAVKFGEGLDDEIEFQLTAAQLTDALAEVTSAEEEAARIDAERAEIEQQAGS